jgi:hypothetical protein
LKLPVTLSVPLIVRFWQVEVLSVIETVMPDGIVTSSVVVGTLPQFQIKGSFQFPVLMAVHVANAGDSEIALNKADLFNGEKL